MTASEEASGGAGGRVGRGWDGGGTGVGGGVQLGWQLFGNFRLPPHAACFGLDELDVFDNLVEHGAIVSLCLFRVSGLNLLEVDLHTAASALEDVS